jgi:hypothetical protein
LLDDTGVQYLFSVHMFTFAVVILLFVVKLCYPVSSIRLEKVSSLREVILPQGEQSNGSRKDIHKGHPSRDLAVIVSRA